MPEKQFLVEKPGEKIASEGAGEGDGNPCQNHCRDHDNGDLDCLKGADQDPAGDINYDGLINILDVVILVNLILG